jgi:hypothetical protein
MTQPENEQDRPAPETTPERHERPAGGEEHGGDPGRVIVVTPEGMGVAHARQGGEKEQRPAEMVEQPAKVMRVASMIKQLLEEVREAPLDEASRQRMAEIHRRSIVELEAGLSQELVDELERITLPFTDAAPSEAELRVAQAQLVGWLEGLFHGIQTAIVAQQMAAQAQLQQMRRALPHAAPGQPQVHRPGDDSPTGQYL